MPGLTFGRCKENKYYKGIDLIWVNKYVFTG